MFGQPMNFMENLILMTFVFSLRVNMDEITKYAQLHLLFQASFLNIKNTIMFLKDMAFVCTYKELLASRLNKLVNCEHMAQAHTS
jgi:hypothetical protein